MEKLDGRQRLGSVVKRLHSTLELLPTAADKKAAVEAIEKWRAFLNDLQLALNSLPSREQTEELRRSLLRLEEFLTKAGQNPVLSAALAPYGAKAAKQAPRAPTAEQLNEARRTLERLERLPIDAIKESLEEETTYSVRELRLVAHVLGLRSSEKVNREALADRIAKAVSNARGYRSLAGMAKKGT